MKISSLLFGKTYSFQTILKQKRGKLFAVSNPFKKKNPSNGSSLNVISREVEYLLMSTKNTNRAEMTILNILNH